MPEVRIRCVIGTEAARADAKRLSWTMHMDAYQDWVRRNAPVRPTVFHKGLGALMRLVRSTKG